MKKNTGIVNCIFGLVLVVGVLVGGMLGLDVDYILEPIDTPQVSEDAETEGTAVENTKDAIESVVEDVEDVVGDVNDNAQDTTDDTTVKTPDTSADSTETEDDVPTVDEPVGNEVTEPTDEPQNNVTEGEN